MTARTFPDPARTLHAGLSRRALLVAGLCGPAMLTSACGGGSSEPAGLGDDADAADAIVQAYMSKYRVPAMSIAVARGRTPIAERAYGTADIEGSAQATADSRFRIASLSKALTSAAVLQLVEAGLLQLTDKVFSSGGLLPEFSGLGTQPDWLNAITVHHLLTHTCGGWSNDANDPMFQKLGLDHAHLIADTLATHALDHPPGDRFAYSNFGYCVLGRVIEKVTQQPYAAHVRQKVLSVVGSADMVIATKAAHPNEVRYYPQDGGDPYALAISRMDSHGGWVATAGELVRCVAGIFSVLDGEGAPAVLSSASVATATQGTSANSGYGCGWILNPAGNQWHDGSLTGTSTIMVHTKTGLSWVALLNTRSADPNAAGDLDRMMWNFVGALQAQVR